MIIRSLLGTVLGNLSADEITGVSTLNGHELDLLTKGLMLR
jgi:hypothetical protein